MGGVYNTHGNSEKYVRILLLEPERTRSLERPGHTWKIILKFILKE
jgi:hypothetical protein